MCFYFAIYSAASCVWVFFFFSCSCKQFFFISSIPSLFDANLSFFGIDCKCWVLFWWMSMPILRFPGRCSFWPIYECSFGSLAGSERDFLLHLQLSVAVFYSLQTLSHPCNSFCDGCSQPAPGFRCLLEGCIVTYMFSLSCVRSGLSVTKSHLSM